MTQIGHIVREGSQCNRSCGCLVSSGSKLLPYAGIAWDLPWGFACFPLNCILYKDPVLPDRRLNISLRTDCACSCVPNPHPSHSIRPRFRAQDNHPLIDNAVSQDLPPRCQPPVLREGCGPRKLVPLLCLWLSCVSFKVFPRALRSFSPSLRHVLPSPGLRHCSRDILPLSDSGIRAFY